MHATHNLCRAAVLAALVALVALPAVAGLTSFGPENQRPGERLIALPNSPGVAAVWTEVEPDGLVVQKYAVSLDGHTFSFPIETTYRIRLRYAEFDPAIDTPVVPQHLQATPDNGLYIVQFYTQPLEAFQTALKDLGASVRDFLADNALIVAMTPDVRDTVAGQAWVRWVGPYHTAYKLDEAILDLLAADPTSTEMRDYSIWASGEGMAFQQPIVDRIQALGGSVMNTAPDGRRMTVTLNVEQVLAVARMDQVQFMDPWGPGEVDMDVIRVLNGVDPNIYALGFKGQGVRAEVHDTEVQSNHPEWGGQAPLVHGVNGNSGTHGSSVYGICFAVGVVPAARGLCPQREQGIFYWYPQSTQFGGGQTRLAANTEATDPNGPYRSVFQTSSVGSPQITTYTTISAETDDYLFKVDYLSFQSQSNVENSQSSRPQAWAKNIVSVGGVTHGSNPNRQAHYASGSRGPASDNRIKPDLCNAYDNIYTTTAGSGYTNFGGTSGATPCTAGTSGLLMQLWHEKVFPGFGGGPSVFADRAKSTTAKALMVNTAYRYPWTEPGYSTSLYRDRQGWGWVNIETLYNARNKMKIINETDILKPLEVKTYNVNVPANEPELNVTMVYIDVAGNPANQAQHRVNDLTLKVTAPDNTVYWGNEGLRLGNYSTPGGAPNTKDTVENVFIKNPAAGKWVVEVRGDEITKDTHVETPELDADYALVIRGITPGMKGDLNCDGVVNNFDIDPFVLALTDPAGYKAKYPNCDIMNGDCNGDGVVDNFDIDPFVKLLTP